MATPYTITRKKIVAETPDLKVAEMTLDRGEEIPGHFHTTVEDIAYCIEGEIEIQIRDPDTAISLVPGQSNEMPPKRVHRVVNRRDGISRFLLIQGIGAYDFVKA